MLSMATRILNFCSMSSSHWQSGRLWLCSGPLSFEHARGLWPRAPFICSQGYLALPMFIFWSFNRPDWLWLMLVAVTFDLPPLAALPICMSCLFSRPDWLWVMFLAFTFDLPPAEALPMSISCLFNRPDWLWLILSTVTCEVDPL